MQYDIHDAANGLDERDLDERELRAVMLNAGLTSPGAEDDPIGDVIFQVVEVNGGEVTITPH